MSYIRPFSLPTLAAALSMAVSSTTAEARGLVGGNEILRNNPDIAETMIKAARGCRNPAISRAAYIQCVGDTQRALVVLGDMMWEGLNTAFNHLDEGEVQARAQYIAGKLEMTTLCINPLQDPPSGTLEHVMPRLNKAYETCFEAIKYAAYGHGDLSSAPNDDFKELLLQLEVNLDLLQQTPIPPKPEEPAVRKI
jgi:hypothetical protein